MVIKYYKMYQLRENTENMQTSENTGRFLKSQVDRSGPASQKQI